MRSRLIWRSPRSPSPSRGRKAFPHKSCQRRADQPEERGGIRHKVWVEESVPNVQVEGENDGCRAAREGQSASDGRSRGPEHPGHCRCVRSRWRSEDLGASQPVGRARCSGDERRKWKPPTKLVDGLATAVCRDGESIKREDEMRPITRRRFLQYGAGAGAALAVPWASRIPVASAAPGGKLTKYVQPA